jgi:hypothetical protein
MLTEHGDVARLNARLADKRSAARVAAAQRLVEAAEELRVAAVAAERDRGVSWGAIGEALNVTRSTAHGRFADRVEATTEHGISAERALDQEWQQVLTLAESHLTPLVSCIGALDTEGRRKLTENLQATVFEATLPEETRIGAVQMLVTLERGTYAGSLERILREGVGASGAPQHAQPSRAGSQLARGAISPVKLIDVSAPYGNSADHSGSGKRLALMNAAIEAHEALILKHEEIGNDHPGAADMRERIAALMLMRFDDLRDSSDLELAIGHLRSIHETGDQPASSECLELLAAALNRRYKLRDDFADLHDAIELLARVVADKSQSFGNSHPETFRARFALAESIARSGDSELASRQFSELLMDQLRVLSSDHPDVLQTHEAYALALSECGELSRAEQILAEQVAIKTRVRGADHPETIDTRANLLKVMVRRLTETDDTELIARMDLAAWSIIADGLSGDPELQGHFTGRHAVPSPAEINFVSLSAGSLPPGIAEAVPKSFPESSAS